MASKTEIEPSFQTQDFLERLEKRFAENPERHKNLSWQEIKTKLLSRPQKLEILWQMEETGGEPDVVQKDSQTGEFLFVDCSKESPKGRRSLCYDEEALESRKKHKPQGSALGMAIEIGIELLNEDQYRKLQQLGHFDTKTSSWLATPTKIRDLGGALFGDFRFQTTFVYHNGAESYYASRGFRGCLKV